jgi:hypothetical protein
VSDVLAPLLELDSVAAAVKAAQDAVFAVHRHPANLRGVSATAAEAAVRAARASAAIEGADPEIPADAAVTDPVLTGALRVAEASESLLPTWRRAPRQALARMHVLVAADLVADPDGMGTAARLDLLAQLVTGGTSVSGVVLATVIHGELLALRPFGAGDGVVARAAARLTMVATGVDPKSLTVPEVAYLRQVGRYHEAAGSFATGEPAGVREWFLFCCEALEEGAREARGIAQAIG